jgi:phage-related protein
VGVKLAVQTLFSAIDHLTGPMAGMRKGVSGFAQHASRASRGVGAGFRGMGGIIRTAAAALATGAVAKAVSDFGTRADDISDISKRVGFSAQAWQEYVYAAKAADMTSEDLTGVVQKMNNNLGQLKQGTGSLFTNLKKTNPQLALQLKHTSDSGVAFQILMDAIKGETDVTKRAALSQAAFGKSGQAIIDMAGDLNEKRAEARASGSIISQADIDAGQNLHNTLIRLKASGMGILNTVLGRVAHSIGPILEKFNQWIQVNREFIGQKLDIIFRVIGNVFQQLGPSIVRVIEKLLPAIEKVIDKALPILVDLLEMLLPILDPLLELLDPILDIFVALAPAIKAVAELVKTILVPVLEILKPILQLLAELMKPVAGAIAFISKGIGGLVGGPLQGLADRLGGGVPVSPNTGAIAAGASGGGGTWNGRLDIAGAPRGSTMKSSGSAPITVGMFNTVAGGVH